MFPSRPRIETQQADFRLVAATHKPLPQMVADGRFRQDLYYRISAFPIHLPPLRDRAADIPMLVDSFLQRGGTSVTRVTVEPAAMARLQTHAWPGNIRELRNVLDRARLFADDGVIRVGHLPHDLGQGAGSVTASPRADALLPGRARTDDATLRRLAVEFSGTRRELAASLGLSERTLYRRLKALGVS
jgi:transcriptional regulator of acetoin/glycerol metabolism